MKVIPLLLVVLALMSAACSKKKKDPEIVTPVEGPKDVPVSREPKAGVEFQEATRQKRFEEYFQKFAQMFEQPSPGSPNWLKLADGRLVGGMVATATQDEIVLIVDTLPMRISAAEIDPLSRARLFAADFARERALRMMKEESSQASPSPPPDAAVRYAMLDSTVARIGPGMEFKRVAGTHTERGQPVTILEQRDNWLRIEDLEGTQRWLSVFMTYQMDETGDPALTNRVEELKRSGLLLEEHYEVNEAHVDSAIWRGTDSKLRIGIARVLAAHCASVNSNTSMFLTIRDKSTQRRLGKYSQSMGWKDAQY